MSAPLAIVVVSHSSGATLSECVERALADPGVAELLVVDNRSVDGSIEALEARFGTDTRFALVRNPVNVGFAQACNQGAAATSASYLMFLNPDCLLETDSVAKLLDLARNHPDAGVIGADVRDAAGNPEPAARRRDPTLWRSFCSAAGLDRYAARWPALAGVTMPVPQAAREVSRVDATSGALLLLPRVVFERLAGFDPGYPLHAEDLDLCRRARRAGYAVLVAERVRVTHYKGGSSGRAPWRVAWCKHRGLWRYYRKFEAVSWPARAAAWLMVFGHFALLAPWLALRQWRAAAARP
jgi:GT2 family glycosyltransferase